MSWSSLHLHLLFIECSVCSTWFHIECQNVNKTVFKYFKSSDIPYICIVCTKNEFPAMIQGREFLKKAASRLDNTETRLN